MATTSSMARTVGRMIAENSIEAEEANRKMSRAAHLQAQNQINIRNAEREKANNLQGAMSTVGVAMSAVKAGQAVVNVGQAIDTAPSEASTRTNLQQSLEAGSGEGTSGPSDIRNVRLGEGGPTVGERFNEEQIEVLTRNGPITETQAELEAKGFSGPEARELIARGRDGFDHDDATTFMWNNRATQDQKNSQHTKDKIQEGVLKFAQDAFGYGMKDGIKKSNETGKEAKEQADELSKLGGDIRDLTFQHQEALNEIELQGIKDKAETQTRTQRRSSK